MTTFQKKGFAKSSHRWSLGKESSYFDVFFSLNKTHKNLRMKQSGNKVSLKLRFVNMKAYTNKKWAYETLNQIYFS